MHRLWASCCLGSLHLIGTLKPASLSTLQGRLGFKEATECPVLYAFKGPESDTLTPPPSLSRCRVGLQRGTSILSWPSFLPKVYQVQSLLHAVRLSLEDKLPMTVFCKLGRTRRKQKAYYCHPRNTAAFTNQPRIYFFFLAPGLSEVKSENSRATRGLSAICDPAGHDGTSL